MAELTIRKPPSQAGIWVLGFDFHNPHIHKPTFRAMMQYLDSNPIRGFVFGGDQQDNAEISHFNQRRIIFREPGAYARNTLAFDRDVITPIEKVLRPDATRVWIKGNHDDWERQLIEEQPELQGTIERDLMYGLRERGWIVKECGHGYEVGKLLVVHGETLGGQNHSKKASENYAQSVAYGHFHTMQSHTKILPQSKTDKWLTQSFPAMCQTNPVYLRNKPTAWLNGFGIVEVDERGCFNAYPIVVTNGKFRFGGITYGG